MILELVSKNDVDVWASVYTNKNVVKNLLLKSGDNKKIVIDNPTDTIEVRFHEKISLLGHIVSAVWELICQFIDYHERAVDLINCNFITTQIQPTDNCETIRIEYDTKYFQNAKRDAKIGMVSSDKCKSRYLFDRKSFVELDTNDRIQALFAGLIISIAFILLFMRYFSLQSMGLCVLLAVSIILMYLFFYYKKKETRDVQLIGKFEEDLQALSYI